MKIMYRILNTMQCEIESDVVYSNSRGKTSQENTSRTERRERDKVNRPQEGGDEGTV